MNKPAIEETSNNTSSTAALTKKTYPRFFNARNILFLITLLIILGITIGSWYAWQRSQQQSQEQLNRLERDLSHTNDLLKEQEHALKALQEKSQMLAQQNLEKQNGHTLPEVNYLVQLAAFHLTFENNTALAGQLLEEADKRISNDKTPALWPLRKIFSQDIAMLNAAPIIDLPGLIARLGTLSQQTEELLTTPIPTETNETATSSTTDTSISPTNSWLDTLKKFVSVAGHALSNMVIISKDSKIMPALLTTEQRLYVITNLQSQLTLVQWAAINRQPKIYQQSLLQVDTWLRRYFSADNALVQNMLKTVEELKNISVNPKTPTILRSLDALEQIKK